MEKSQMKVRLAPPRLLGVIFLTCLVVGLFPLAQVGTAQFERQNPFINQSPINQALEHFDEESEPLVQVPYGQNVTEDALLDIVTLESVWSYAYSHQALAEKILKDSWIAFKEEQDYQSWKGFFPQSASLLVTWYENETSTYKFAAMSAIAITDEATGMTSISWYLNKWTDSQYNVYVMKDYFLKRFIPAAARADRSLTAYQRLDDELRSGAEEGQFRMTVRWRAGNLDIPVEVPLGLLLAGAALFFRGRRRK
jgi:hypothetical protein